MELRIGIIGMGHLGKAVLAGLLKSGVEITKRVFETAVDIIRNDDSSFEKLVEQISTKGGMTEAGINVLMQGNLDSIFDACMNEAISRVKK